MNASLKSIPYLIRSCMWWKCAAIVNKCKQQNLKTESIYVPTPKNRGQINTAVIGGKHWRSKGNMQLLYVNSSEKGATKWFLNQIKFLKLLIQYMGSVYNFRRPLCTFMAMGPKKRTIVKNKGIMKAWHSPIVFSPISSAKVVYKEIDNLLWSRLLFCWYFF